MKKTVTILAVLLFSIFNSYVNAQYTVEHFDTLFHTQVGAGAFYTEYENPAGPLKVQVVEFELGQPGMEIRTVAANNLLAGGYQQTSDMKNELEDENTFVVAGVNGDFYLSGGLPTNAQVIEGELLRTPVTREVLAFDDSFQPWISRTTFSGTVTADGFSAPVNNVNAVRSENQLVLYNPYYGGSTESNAFGLEIALKRESDVKVNREAQYTVTRIEENTGNMEFGTDDIILSAHGTAVDDFSTVAIGDTLIIQLNLNPLESAIIEAVGGNGQFLKNGEVIETWAEWHPRTAVGFNQDTTKLFFMVVDGRQPASRGMTTGQMGFFMESIGVADAVNLDGGGSSTMVVQDEVMNNPSDGIERSVANALFVTLPYSGSGEVVRIKLRTNKTKVFIDKTTSLKALGFDENHKFNEVPAEEVVFTADDSLGEVSSSGIFTASMEAGSGYVYANYGEFTDSTFITVLGAGNINLTPDEIALDTSMTFAPNYSLIDELGFEQEVSRSDIEWAVTNLALGEIDNEGNYTPLETGLNGIIGTYGGVSDTIWAEVQVNSGYSVLSDFSDVNSWTVETENLATDSVSLHQIDGGIEVRFSYPPSGNEPHIHLNNTLEIPGVPSFANVVSSSDGENYVMTVDIQTNSGNRFRMNPVEYANYTEPTVMHFKFNKNDVTALNSTNFYFPFTYESVNIRIPKNSTDSTKKGFFRLYELGVSYTDTPVSTEENPGADIPTELRLHQNYPNPFNPVTNITFNVPNAGHVELSIFDILGRKVVTLIDGRVQAGSHTRSFDASKLSSGIYLYRLETEQASLSRKMTLIK